MRSGESPGHCPKQGMVMMRNHQGQVKPFRELDVEDHSAQSSCVIQKTLICKIKFRFLKGSKIYMPDEMQNSFFLNISDPLTCTLQGCTAVLPLLSLYPESPSTACVPLSSENGQCQAIQPEQREIHLNQKTFQRLPILRCSLRAWG